MTDTDRLYTDHLPGRTLVIDGEEYLFCSGTSYLGIACNEQFRQHLIEGISRYGTNYSSSRNSNLQLAVFEEAEEYLASYTGSEAALTMSSGYLAGQTLVQALQGQGPLFYAPGTHPALWRTVADAPDAALGYDAWVAKLLQEVKSAAGPHVLIVCNSLDPLLAREYHFSWLSALPEDKRFTLIIDDSHGIGVTGKNGAGISSVLQVPEHVRLIVISSLGKACGIPAGVITGDKQTIEQLKASSYFGGASPAIPAYLYAFLRSTLIFQEARERLYGNIRSFREQLLHPDLFNTFDNYPVFNTRQGELCAYLLAHKVLISSFRYPTPVDEPITRVILNSLHTQEDLERLTSLINQFEEVPGRQ